MADKVDKVSTSCFTYEVRMVVQVLAEDREAADAKLEREGGFISRREVTFRDYVSLYIGKDEDEPKSEDSVSEETTEI